MNSNVAKAIVPIVILAVAVVLAFILIISKEEPEQHPVVQKALLVQADPVSAQDIQFEVSSQGTLLPKTTTAVVTQVSGKITEVASNFIEGGFFKKGDVLVKLEQDDYLTELKLAEAELARTQAALQEEMARGKVAAEDWKTVKNSVAPELGLRKPQLATAQANVRAAEAQLERAQRNLSRTTIRAPYDGLVKSKNADLGQFVSMGAQLGVIYATNVGEVRLPLSDDEMAFLPADIATQQPEVILSSKVAGREYQWSAKLVRSEGVVDETSRVIYVVAELPDPYAREASNESPALKFGRFVQAQIQGKSINNIVVIPRHVLRIDGSLLVVEPDHTLSIRNVELARADEDFAYVIDGVKDGELVISSAVPNPVDGLKVRLPNEPKPEAKSGTDEGQD